jgi:hypothetical protein
MAVHINEKQFIYMDRYAILHIEGGIGKNVMATAVVRAINKEHPDRKIIVLTAHPDIWTNNLRVHKSILFGTAAYFYTDYIMDKDTIVFAQEPYRHTDYIYRKKHLTQIWCDLCGVKWDGDLPELYFTKLEQDFCSMMIQKDDRPIFLVNAFGGSPDQAHKYSWARDIPPYLAQEIVREASKTHRVIQIRREDQISLDCTESYTANVRQTMLILTLSDKRLLIDSLMQHAAAALGLKSTVLWSANNPKVFGYELHDNILSSFEPGEIKNSIYEPYDITGDPAQIATPPSMMFDKGQIMSSLGFDPDMDT